MTHAKSEVPGRSAAKARDTSPPQLRMIHRPKLTTTETRQAEHLVMFWVLIGCLTFAVIIAWHFYSPMAGFRFRGVPCPQNDECISHSPQ